MVSHAADCHVFLAGNEFHSFALKVPQLIMTVLGFNINLICNSTLQCVTSTSRCLSSIIFTQSLMNYGTSYLQTIKIELASIHSNVNQATFEMFLTTTNKVQTLWDTKILLATNMDDMKKHGWLPSTLANLPRLNNFLPQIQTINVPMQILIS